MIKLLLLLSLSQVQVIDQTGRNLGRVPTIECGKTMTCNIQHNTWTTINASCSGVLGCIPVCNSGQFLSNDGGTLYCTSQIPNTYPTCAAGQFLYIDGGNLDCATPPTTSYSGLLLSSQCQPGLAPIDGGQGVCLEDVPFVGAADYVGPSNLSDGGFLNFVDVITCSWGVAGIGGTQVVVAIDDKSASISAICSCTLGACITAAGTPLKCVCSAGITAGHMYAVRMTSATDCTTDPVSMSCSANFTVLAH